MAWSPDYCTGFDLKEFLRIPLDDTRDDLAIETAISAASRAIDRACNRQFGEDDAPTTRYYTAWYDRWSHRWTVPIDDLMESTALAVTYDSGSDFTYSSAITAHRLLPLNAQALGRPWTSLVLTPGAAVQLGGGDGAVGVTATFGWTAVPAGIKQATMLQASRFVARRESPYGIAGSPDVGSELRLLSKLDPDVEVSIAPYRRTWSVAR